MPRQSRSRPSARPASSSSSFGSGGQTRSASTAAYPPTYSAPPQSQSQAYARPQTQERQPGFLAQMAATAGSVAVGSTVGHGLSHMLFGGRSEAPAPVEQAQPVQQYQPQNSGLSCDFQAKEFTKCMENGDINTCGWYLDQLKACQAAARPY